MRRLVVAALAAVAVASAASAQPKDTPLAAFTRVKKLKAKVTLDLKNEFLKEAFNEISGQIEEQKRGPLKVEYATGVSQNTRVTFAAKDVTVEEALDGILKQLDLGYVVVSNMSSRSDGYLKIAKGPERGYEAGQEPKGTGTPVAAGAKPADPKKPEMKAEEPKKPEPKPEMKPEEPKPAVAEGPKASPEDEKLAAAKLDLAKKLTEDGKADRAKVQLKFVTKQFPGTKAAAEAKELLDKADKEK